MALRWKKEARETGLRAVGAAPRSSYLHDGKNKYATVAPRGGGWRTFKGWYFYSHSNEITGLPHKNTCNEKLFKTEDEAKCAAKSFVLNSLNI